MCWASTRKKHRLSKSFSTTAFKSYSNTVSPWTTQPSHLPKKMKPSSDTSSFSTQNKKQQRTVWITHPLDQWDQYTSLLLLFLETKVKSNSELPDEWKTGSMQEKYMDLFCFPIISVKRDWGVTDAKPKVWVLHILTASLPYFLIYAHHIPPKWGRERKKKPFCKMKVSSRLLTIAFCLWLSLCLALSDSRFSYSLRYSSLLSLSCWYSS